MEDYIYGLIYGAYIINLKVDYVFKKNLATELCSIGVSCTLSLPWLVCVLLVYIRDGFYRYFE